MTALDPVFHQPDALGATDAPDVDENDASSPFQPRVRADARAGFRPTHCQWLMRPIRTEPHRRPRPEDIDACKCGDPVAPGRSYCPGHLERAVMRIDSLIAMRAADRLVARMGIRW